MRQVAGSGARVLLSTLKIHQVGLGNIQKKKDSTLQGF